MFDNTINSLKNRMVENNKSIEYNQREINMLRTALNSKLQNIQIFEQDNKECELAISILEKSNTND